MVFNKFKENKGLASKTAIRTPFRILKKFLQSLPQNFKVTRSF